MFNFCNCVKIEVLCHMFMFQKTDCSIGHGTVNIVLVLAMCQAKIHPPSFYVTKYPAK